MVIRMDPFGMGKNARREPGRTTRREYLNAIRPWYKKADKAAKKAILDEFCRVCGYNRKYAIRLLNHIPDRGSPQAKRKRPGPRKPYHHPLIPVWPVRRPGKPPDRLEVLQQLWRVLNLPCSRRHSRRDPFGKAAIPLWLPYYEQHFKKALPESIKQRLFPARAGGFPLGKGPLQGEGSIRITISPATIDRLMAPMRSKSHSRRDPFGEADTWDITALTGKSSPNNSTPFTSQNGGC